MPLNYTMVSYCSIGMVIFWDLIQYITVQCISLLHLLSEENKSMVNANYSHPAIEGTIAVFSCSSCGYMLTGPSTVTCVGNGEWVPDPREVQCEGKVTM